MEKKRFSDQKIWAIQQVLTADRDVVELLIKKSVTPEDLVFQLQRH